MSLILKIGRAPLHFWLPRVINGLSWTNCLILITWQKITPIILTSFVRNIFYLPLLFIILSAIFGALGGLNQTNLKKLIAFSSINHISWILLALTINEILWFVYFIIYSVISFSIISLFIVHNTSHINQIWRTINKKNNYKINILLCPSIYRRTTPLFRVLTQMNNHFFYSRKRNNYNINYNYNISYHIIFFISELLIQPSH